MMKNASLFVFTFSLLFSTNVVLGQLTDDGCWGEDASKIRENEINRNLKEPYTYIICPGTFIRPGNSIMQGPMVTGFEDGRFPIMLKSNARVQCGENGDPADECVIDGTGSHGLLLQPPQLLGPVSIIDPTKPNLKNIEIVGLTFEEFSIQGQTQSMVAMAGTHGQVTFERCKFQFSTGAQPLFHMNYLVANGKDFNISFNRCKFESIQLPGIETVKTTGGLQLLNFDGFKFDPTFAPDLLGTKVNAVFDRTTFSDVNTNSESDAEMISRSIITFLSSGKLTLKDACFNNIAVSTKGSSDIVRLTEESELEFSNVYLDTETTTYFPDGATPECPFMSILKVNEDFSVIERSKCGPEPDAMFCTADITSAPTTSPTKAPIDTLPPTDAPTKAPVPTLPPTDAPTPPPVATSPPTDAPTPSPTDAPTLAAPKLRADSAAVSLSSLYRSFTYIALVAWFFL